MVSFIKSILDGDFDFSGKLGRILMLSVFVLVVSFCLSSKFLSQDLLENGIGKKTIVAKKTIEVVDVQKTELLRQDVAKKIKPIIIPVDSSRVLNSFYTLKENALKVKSDDSDKQSKKIEFSNIFDITNQEKKELAVNFALNSSKRTFSAILDSADVILNKYVKKGLQEGDIDAYTSSEAITKMLGYSLPENQIATISGVLETVILPNLVIDDYATDVARKNAKNLIKPYTVTFKKGDTILKPDEILTQVKRDALKKSGYSLLEMNKSGVFGIILFTLLCTLSVIFYIKYREKKYDDPRYYMILGLLSVILSFFCVQISSNNAIPNYLMPIPAFTIIMAVFTTPTLAFIASIVFIALISSTLFLEPQFVAIYIFGTLTAVFLVSKISYTRRQDLIKCGIWTGIVMAFFIVAINIFEEQLSIASFTSSLKVASFALLNGFFSGVLPLGTIPVFESVFKTITPYGLIELADHNSPVLVKLQNKAPGTYHHSLMVANLCEAASEAVGADPILARVGAFYHDIGKLQKPLFFIENQSYFGVENPHNNLNPRLSKMAIISHVKEGVELAKKEGLPQEIINFIQQHHGEALAGHFYNQAVKLEGAENVQQEQFRYSGPKPNMKETAILMLSDAVESAVRSLKNPTPDEIENMINKIITERLNDGQLSDSPLTLKDIKLIAITFNRILKGMQHDRVKYQESAINELDKNKILFQENKEENGREDENKGSN